jgi:putative tricarboxylic transport membrane protein
MSISSEQNARDGGTAMRIGTIAVAVVLIGVSVAVVVGARSFPGPTTLGAPGPARLPAIYAVVLAALSLGLIASTFLGGPQPQLRVGRLWQVIALMVWTALYVALLPQLGFLTVTIPWLFVATRMLGTGWGGSLATATTVPLVLFASFDKLLGIPLP